MSSSHIFGVFFTELCQEHFLLPSDSRANKKEDRNKKGQHTQKYRIVRTQLPHGNRLKDYADREKQ